MAHVRFILLTFFLLASCLSTARAQQPNSPPTETNEALRQKAFDLLDSIAGQISIMKSPENRVRVAANIVDTIWEHDEKRARTLVVSVQEDQHRPANARG
jgi:biopolymer transport protein ExbD